MNRISIFALLLASLGATQTWATPASCPNSATPLTTYLSQGFSCEIGDKVFSNFTYTDSAFGAIAIPPASVSVETVGPISGLDPAQILNVDIGLQFSAGWTALPGQETDAAIGFTVAVVNGFNMLIEDTGLAQTSGVSGSSSVASVSEKACTSTPPATCIPGTVSVMTFDTGNSQTSQVVSDVTFAPSGSITVSKDITASDSGASGSATISVVSDTFSQIPVPEPATAFLVGAALWSMATIRRRMSRNTPSASSGR